MCSGSTGEYLSCITGHYSALPPAAGEPAFDAPAGLDTIDDLNTRSLFSLLLFGVKGLAAYYSPCAGPWKKR